MEPYGAPERPSTRSYVTVVGGTRLCSSGVNWPPSKRGPQNCFVLNAIYGKISALG